MRHMFLIVLVFAACGEPERYATVRAGGTDGGNDPNLCGNAQQDQGESDTDCGKVCANKCGADKKCTYADDCAAGLNCQAGFCKTKPVQSGPTCADGQKNGNETSVDCGGSCPGKCGFNAACSIDNDCTTAYCDVNKQCTNRPTCSDNTLNQGESDTDCGKVCANKCGADKKCTYADDCATGLACQAGLCKVPPAPTCSVNNAKDGSETDTDCGGNACGPCGDGKFCLAWTDCTSKSCGLDAASNTYKCQTSSSSPTPSCTNQAHDSSESDVDCGGVCATKCGDGKACVQTGDCAAGFICGTNNRCVAGNGNPTPPTPSTNLCGNAAKDGDETDVDCGGASCAKCAEGRFCQKAEDCQSLMCYAQTVRCIGTPVVTTPVNVDPTLASGTFKVTAEFVIEDGRLVLKCTSDKPIYRLYYKAEPDALSSAWRIGDTDGSTACRIPVPYITGPAWAFGRVRVHAENGENGESSTIGISVPAGSSSGLGDTTNGMLPTGGTCSAHIQCASKSCDMAQRRCAPVTARAPTDPYIIEGIPNQAGPVNIVVHGVSGLSDQLSMSVSIPSMCNTQNAGYNGTNEYVVVCGTIQGRGFGGVQIRLPGSYGIVWGQQYSQNGSCTAFRLDWLYCHEFGYFR